MSKQVLVLGAGYAGLTVAIRLARAGHRVNLLNRTPHFLDLIRLNKTIHTPLAKFQKPLADLARQFDFRATTASVDLAGFDPVATSRAGRLETDAGDFEFDALVMCTGSVGIPRLDAAVDPALLGSRVLTLNTLREQDGNAAVLRFLKEAPENPGVVFVGGGATALQFLFEFKDFMQGVRRSCRIALIDMEARPLARFPERFSEYADERITARGIDYRPATKFLGQQGDTVSCETIGGEAFTMDSSLTFLFPGVQATPALATDEFGRVQVDGQVLTNVYSAGDCSDFAGGGLNSLTAQAAVRKARRVAVNIDNEAAGRPLEAYTYKELGYFVSLGFWDGVGYVLADDKVATGVPAFAIKEAIEQQFALFAKGFDTYSIVEGIPGLG